GLMIPLKVGGIALASSVAALVDFIWLFYCLDKRLGGIDGGFKIFVAKIVAASLVAGMVVSQIWNTACVPDERLRLFLAVILGALVYGSVCFMLKIGQARAFYRWLQNLGTKAG
ncbi:MAG TPA: polysaccharide biosynthesis C-terminal domain-containing protein, partial [Candidatus Omnitrophota bacterium]|nr:polysaccharide biosynthesis C-terminal domain-containing protein [Candidatus Omnitrophota bacterium]